MCTINPPAESALDIWRTATSESSGARGSLAHRITCQCRRIARTASKQVRPPPECVARCGTCKRIHNQFYRRQASPEGQQEKDCSLLCPWGKVPRLIILHQQGQVPFDGTPQDQSQDASPLERADVSQQWHGLCQAERGTPPLHKGLGELLSPCHYEETDRGNRRVVTETLAYVYMEVMETFPDPNQKPP